MKLDSLKEVQEGITIHCHMDKETLTSLYPKA